MALIDDLERLGALHEQGRLTQDEFTRAKAQLLQDESPAPAPAMAAVNRLRRSRNDRWIGGAVPWWGPTPHDRWIAGVCGGVAVITGVESWVWRLILAVLALFGGTGVLLYILLWMFVPDE
jgi:phage shock protein C